jgi:hypothetical protein
MVQLSEVSADDGTGAWAPPEVTPRQQDGTAHNYRRLDEAQCAATNSVSPSRNNVIANTPLYALNHQTRLLSGVVLLS